jgi:hypothetical protein
MLMQPPLALGQAVHESIDSLSSQPAESRFATPLGTRFEQAWKSVSGKMGGFESESEEEKFKTRGAGMIKRLVDHPGPIANKAIKLRQDLPYFWLSEEDNIILCGKIDWLEYLELTDSVHIIDFKTGKFDEDPDSLQLPIYILLASKCQTRKIEKVSYWYLDRDDAPTQVPLIDESEAMTRITAIAKKIHLARKLEHFKCPSADGCRVCRPYEAIISGRATFVGVGGYSQDIYINMRSLPGISG